MERELENKLFLFNKYENKEEMEKEIQKYIKKLKKNI